MDADLRRAGVGRRRSVASEPPLDAGNERGAASPPRAAPVSLPRVALLGLTATAGAAAGWTAFGSWFGAALGALMATAALMSLEIVFMLLAQTTPLPRRTDFASQERSPEVDVPVASALAVPVEEHATAKRAPQPVSKPPPVVEPEHPWPKPAPAPATRAGSCRISWWRGYVKSEFYAWVADEGGGGPGPIARSPSFRWHSSEPPAPTPAAVAAHDALLAALVAAGWERDPEEPVGPWYALTLHRGEPPRGAP